MIKQNNKSIETEIDLRKTDKKSVFNGSVIAFFILATPFLFYSYKSFPDVKVWETSFFSIKQIFILGLILLGILQISLFLFIYYLFGSLPASIGGIGYYLCQ